MSDCVPCRALKNCLTFGDFAASKPNQKLYLNTAQNVTVTCPDLSTPTVAIPAGVIGFVLDFAIGSPPYPDLTLNCVSGQIVVPVPDNATQAQLDGLIAGLLNQCAVQIAKQYGCVPGTFYNTQQVKGCNIGLTPAKAGGLPVGVSIETVSGASVLVVPAGLISSTVSIADANLKASQLLNEIFATGNVTCTT